MIEYVDHHHCPRISSGFSSNSEADASELLENHEEMFHAIYLTEQNNNTYFHVALFNSKCTIKSKIITNICPKTFRQTYKLKVLLYLIIILIICFLI